MPIILLIVSGRIAALPIGIALALSTASVQAADVDAFDAVSELLEATLFRQEGSRLPYNQSYQFITELQGRSLN